MLLSDLYEDLPAVPLDMEGMSQVAANVLSNAIDAVENGAGRINVCTAFDPEHERVTLSISDNGPGIPAGQLDRIFEAFHSTKGHGGTGLGLAAAHKIVSELGGQIDVDSTAGQGTTFHIHLPLRTIRLAGSAETKGPPERA
jgi:two-component system, sporulation sensor kinase E